jgi:hypothetical protein
MPGSVKPPHADDLETAVAHFNAVFRRRYRLPTITSAALRDVPGLQAELGDLAVVRANGVPDALCALIARAVLSVVPM